MHTHVAIPCGIYQIARHLNVTQPRTFVSVDMIDIAVIYQVLYYRYKYICENGNGKSKIENTSKMEDGKWKMEDARCKTQEARRKAQGPRHKAQRIQRAAQCSSQHIAAARRGKARQGKAAQNTAATQRDVTQRNAQHTRHAPHATQRSA